MANQYFRELKYHWLRSHVCAIIYCMCHKLLHYVTSRPLTGTFELTIEEITLAIPFRKRPKIMNQG